MADSLSESIKEEKCSITAFELRFLLNPKNTDLHKTCSSKSNDSNGRNKLFETHFFFDRDLILV